MSRKIRGEAGEDLVEKQNSEQGLMPVIADEPGVYGYTAENRHMVQAFLAGRMPDENWHDGLAVTEVLMACYKSAEEGRTMPFPGRTRRFRTGGGARRLAGIAIRLSPALAYARPRAPLPAER